MTMHLGHETVIDKPKTDIPVPKQLPKEPMATPNQYAVLALDDNTTPHAFVQEILCGHFNVSVSKAREIMRAAEKHGKAVVNLYSKDIAETKAKAANDFARATQNPVFNTPMELTFICEPA